MTANSTQLLGHPDQAKTIKIVHFANLYQFLSLPVAASKGLAMEVLGSGLFDHAMAGASTCT